MPIFWKLQNNVPVRKTTNPEWMKKTTRQYRQGELPRGVTPTF